MNLPYEKKDRRVVPNWRYYETTLAAGELDIWKKVPSTKGNPYPIDDYIGLWKEHHSIYRAGDLLSAAITNGSEDVDVVKDAASFILKNEDTSTSSLISTAKKVLGVNSSDNSQSKFEIDRLRECTDIEDIKHFIHNVRQRLHFMPYNPFLYVDLARAYILIGQTQKATESILNAMHFGGTDRFVARSAARFFLHMQDKDMALEAIRAKGAVSVDPWLMAAEISINMLRGKASNYIKRGKDIIDSGNCRPFSYTELASSIGTLELIAGSNRKSNKLFKKALIEPNDNSLAQIQWINSSIEPLSFNINARVHNNYEARTMEAFSNGDLNCARHEAVSWICDMPFAHKPVNIGYAICVNHLHDFALASAILDVGLRADETNPLLLNNKAYCAARAGQLTEAQQAFDKLKKSTKINDSSSWKVCIPATEGLLLYRNNQLNEGRQKYEEALSIAKQISDVEEGKMLYRKALLNFCREKLIAQDGTPANIIEEVHSIEIDKEEKELKMLSEEIETEYKKIKK